MIMPFGKHRGKHIRNVPKDYLQWVLDKCETASPSLRAYIQAFLFEDLQKTADCPKPDLASVKVMVDCWYRKLCLRYHPDRGGSTEVMQAINNAYEFLLEVLNGP